MNTTKRLFLILWLAGLAGVLSLLLVDIPAVLALMPQPEGAPPVELPPPALLKLATILQPAVLTLLAVAVGLWLAPKVDLHAPVAEALAERRPFWPALRPQLVPGIVAGLAAGVALVLVWMVSSPQMPAEFVTRAREFNNLIPAALRMLYGGVTEEILLRWGFMTFLVWVLWRIFQKGEGRTKGAYVAASLLVSAVLFGIGHLPVASVLAGGLALPIVLYVVVANSLFGIVAGFLYWRLGLESAMLAHMFAHVVMIAAITLAL